MGIDAVELAASAPFTAARGRNAGFDRLLERVPDLQYLQFVDGDCEMVEGWLERAVEELDARPDAAVVAGRLRERDPDASIYSRLCDMEWDTTLGEVDACGGIAMIRTDALKIAGGFDPTLIAGEEPDLCFRLRRDGWKILRIDAEMAAHDADMTRFGQWWRRAVRSGHGFAEGAWRYGRSPERYDVRRVMSIVFWGAGLPALAVAPAWPAAGLSLLLLAAYPIQWLRIVMQQRKRGRSPADGRLYATLILFGKLPECIGLCRWVCSKLGERDGPVT